MTRAARASSRAVSDAQTSVWALAPFRTICIATIELGSSSVALLHLRGGRSIPAELNAFGSFDFSLSVVQAGPVGLASAGLDLAHLVATMDDHRYLRVWDFDVTSQSVCSMTVRAQDDEDVWALLDNLTQVMGPEHPA